MAIVHTVGKKVFIRSRSGCPDIDEGQDIILDEEGFFWRQVGEGLTNEAAQAIARLMNVQTEEV